MPKQTIHVDVLSRTFGVDGAGPIRSCKSLVWSYRRDAAGTFRATFAGSDPRPAEAPLKNTFLRFKVGGRFAFLGLVEEREIALDGKGRYTVQISGRCQLGSLAENTVGLLDCSNAGQPVTDAPQRILAASVVPNQTWSFDMTNGYDETLTPFYRQFQGESALAAFVALAKETGEHFRVSTAGLLEIVWMQTDTPTAPIRFVMGGGPTLHRTKNAVVIEEVRKVENAERAANRIYPIGAGQGDARLTLEFATMVMPAGYTLNAAENYIQRDDQQGLPSISRRMTKHYKSIGLVDDAIDATILIDNDAAAGATFVLVEPLTVALPDNAQLDINGLGVYFVTLDGALGVGASMLTVDPLPIDLSASDVLRYTVATSADAQESAANQLAAAALSDLQKIADPAQMATYDITVRDLPDTVHVGMVIPSAGAIPGFPISDDLIIQEIRRSANARGRMPVVLRVVVYDLFDAGEAAITAELQQSREYRTYPQPVDAAQVANLPPAIPVNHAVRHQHGGQDEVATATPTANAIPKADASGTLDAWVTAATTEGVQDIVAALLDDSPSISWAYDDGAGSLVGSVIDAYVAELARDTLGAALTAGAGISITPSDVGDTITIASTITQYTDEMARDALGAALTAGAGISITPNDAGDTIAVAVVDSYIAELARDTLGTALTNGNGIAKTVNDAGDTITLALTTLTSDWDIGEDRAILAEALRARDGEGLSIYDDGGNLALFIEDGGQVGIGHATPTDDLHVLVDSNAGITVEHVDSGTTNPWYSLKKGSTRQFWALAAAAAAFFAGSAVGDMIFRAAQSTRIIFGIDNGLGTAAPSMALTSTGIGIGTLVPQGKFHIHDGTSGKLLVTKSAVVNVSQTIIADGTGDVTKAVTGFFILDNAGIVANAFTVENGFNLDVVAGGGTWRFAVAANGAFTVIRQSGAGSATITLDIVWQ